MILIIYLVLHTDLQFLQTQRFEYLLQPWESAAAVDNAIVNAVLCGIYDDKKNVVVRFSMSVVFIFTTYIIVGYF